MQKTAEAPEHKFISIPSSSGGRVETVRIFVFEVDIKSTSEMSQVPQVDRNFRSCASWYCVFLLGILYFWTFFTFHLFYDITTSTYFHNMNVLVIYYITYCWHLSVVCNETKSSSCVKCLKNILSCYVHNMLINSSRRYCNRFANFSWNKGFGHVAQLFWTCRIDLHKLI